VDIAEPGGYRQSDAKTEALLRAPAPNEPRRREEVMLLRGIDFAHDEPTEGAPSPLRNRVTPSAPAVLVIEDDPETREVLVEVIRERGRTVFAAGDGAEALRLLDSPLLPRPCVLLLDWRMHRMDGREFLDRLASRFDVAQLPVLLMSASPLPSDVPAPVLVRARLRKPFGLHVLLEGLRVACEQPRPRSPGPR
jgi:CheY-like chemotaxis protein